MQMIHVENEFIGDDGKVDMDAAGANPTGLAILSVMFCVDNKKTQVSLIMKNNKLLNRIQIMELHELYLVVYLTWLIYSFSHYRIKCRYT